jgi:hypothetical protein
MLLALPNRVINNFLSQSNITDIESDRKVRFRFIHQNWMQGQRPILLANYNVKRPTQPLIIFFSGKEHD